MASNFAENLRFLRDSLGLSQSQMGRALGGYGANTYQMWEKGSRPPPTVREQLAAAGVNLHWMDTGDGSMLRDDIERIQVLRDEQNGKATGLRPVLKKGQSPKAHAGDSRALTGAELAEAKTLVDEEIMQGDSPINDVAYWDLVALAAENVRELRELGKEDEIRPRLRRWLQVAQVKP